MTRPPPWASCRLRQSAARGTGMRQAVPMPAEVWTPMYMKLEWGLGILRYPPPPLPYLPSAMLRTKCCRSVYCGRDWMVACVSQRIGPEPRVYWPGRGRVWRGPIKTRSSLPRSTTSTS
jgi:hypothetical protein